jgi:nucleoside-diphosphate-sugar epimerase
MSPGDVAPLIGFSVLGTLTALTIILRGPIGRALARRLEGHAGVVDDRLVEMERRLRDLEAREQRVAELEDRLDFAERLLAQRDEARLPGGGS